MRSDLTRQTRWSHDPEPVDPILTPPGQIYVKQMTWMACTECDLQVHAAQTQAVVTGVICPQCGTRLTTATVIGNPDAEAARLMQDEEYLRDQVLWED
jgi:hypothetical protein